MLPPVDVPIEPVDTTDKIVPKVIAVLEKRENFLHDPIVTFISLIFAS